MGKEKTAGRVLLPAEVEPIHYDVTITTNIDESSGFVFNGKVGIVLNLKSNTSSITLHSRELKFDKATYTPSEGEAISSASVTFDENAKTVAIDFGNNLVPGEGRLEIVFTGVHNNQMAGFYRSKYKDIAGEDKYMVSTQFESLDARRCFPCVDEPARKATFTCSLIIDKHLDALGNMPVATTTDVEVNGVTKKKVSFEKTPKMSTYLVAFCVGEFEYIETITDHGVPVRVYTPPGQKHLGNFALEAGKRSLDIYDGIFGLPYPLPKLDMIAIPEFAMGAMENYGLVTYRAVDLLIDDIRASSQQKQRVCTVVAHELAHQWFGNLVTMAWWDDLWLNEGFASWMQTYATDTIFPDWSMWEQFVINEQAGAMKLDALTTSHPIQVPIKHAEEVEQVFDAISYYKGACVVRLIYAFLGHENFMNGLKQYMEKHKYGNTETFDLWSAWESVSGKPVSKVMASWTEQMGFPVVKVLSSKWIEEKKSFELEIEQKWFLSDGGSGNDEAKLWTIPMFVSKKGDQKQIDMFSEAKAVIMVEAASDRSWIKLNGGQHVPIRVDYTSEMWSNLHAAILSKEMSVTDRAGLLLDAYALTKAGEMEPSALVNLLSAYREEDSYPVWDALKQVLSGLHNVLLEYDEAKGKFESFAAKIIKTPSQKMGWEAKDDDGHLGKLLRSLLIDLQAKFASDDEMVLKEARERYEKFVADPLNPEMANILPAEYKSAVFRIVLKNASDDTPFTQLMKVIDVVETIAEKKIVYNSLGFAHTNELKKKTLEWCTSGEIKLQDFFYPIGSVSASGSEGLNITWEYLKDNFHRIHEMLKSASPSLMAAVVSYSASGFTTDEKASEIEEFFKQNPVELISRKVSQIIENTRATAKFLKRIKASNDFIRSLERVDS